MTIPEYGVTPQGFRSKRLIDIKNELEDLFIGEFGDINLDPQSVTGQLIGIYSKVLADVWENLNDVYESQYPNSATGISLDNVVSLNGITRLPAERTSVIGVATGLEGTLIPAGSLARIPTTGEVFFSTQNVTIDRANSVQNIVNVTAVAAQEYSVVISGVTYRYSRPIITFSAPLASGNAVSVRINGINMPLVNYATSNAATLANLVSVIVANSPAVASGSVVGNSIRLEPTLGFQIVVNSVNISGPGAITAATTYLAPANAATVAQYLSAVLNNAANVTSSWNSGESRFTVTAADSEAPYSLNLGTNLQNIQTSTPVPFLAQTYGPIPVPIGTLTEIVTPIAGWQSVTNFKAGVTGRNVETDAELRIRRANSLRVLGNATVEAIRSRLLQEVPGVSSVTIFENVTMTQDPFDITFSSDFVSGNNIQVDLDGTNIGNVSYAVSHLATITALANLIASQSEIDSAVVGGTGNRSIQVTMKEGEQVSIVLNVTGGGAPTYIIAGGRPPKSFEAVVQGGTDAAVALKIWQSKPAGIQTFGNTSVVITDSQGNPQTINFTRAIPVYIWVTVALTLNPQETFPPNGQQLVSNAILAYGNSLGIGVDVFIQRVQAAIFSVPGIASAVVQLARTFNPTDTPSYGTTDIVIGDTEISSWDLGRITVSI